MLFAVVSFAISLALVPVAIRIAIHFGWYDEPDTGRKAHENRIPHTGGLIIGLAMAVAIIGLWLSGGLAEFTELNPGMNAMYLYMAEAAFVIFLLGAVDDFIELTFAKKFLFQFLAATFIIMGAMRSDVFPRIFSVEHTGILLNSAGTIVSVIWIVGVTNAINMIDGMDGLAGGTSLMSSLTLGIVAMFWGNSFLALLLFILSGAILGFLVFNLPPARIFMGDTGSMLIGFSLAVIGWMLADSMSAKPTHIFIPVVVLGLPISDTLLAFFRRMLTRRNPFNADTFHIHHMLKHRFQLTTKWTVLILWTVNLVYCICGFVLLYVPEPAGWMIITFLFAANTYFLHKLGYTELLMNGKGELKPPAVHAKKNGHGTVDGRSHSGNGVTRKADVRI